VIGLCTGARQYYTAGRIRIIDRVGATNGCCLITFLRPNRGDIDFTTDDDDDCVENVAFRLIRRPRVCPRSATSHSRNYRRRPHYDSSRSYAPARRQRETRYVLVTTTAEILETPFLAGYLYCITIIIIISSITAALARNPIRPLNWHLFRVTYTDHKSGGFKRY